MGSWPQLGMGGMKDMAIANKMITKVFNGCIIQNITALKEFYSGQFNGGLRMQSVKDRSENILKQADWHSLSHQGLLSLLEVNAQKGLSALEVLERRKVYGFNRISQKGGKGPFLRFLLQFHQPLIYILLLSGCITAGLGEWVDSSVIFGVVLLNAVIGFVQESKAVSALSALSRILVSEATVIRDGERRRISFEELVPGDIVLLQSGDKVPADLRLIETRDLQVNESALTGESLPVAKQSQPIPADVGIADRTNMAFASSLVTFGQATGVVVATGDHTEVGRIARLAAGAEEIATPLTRKLASFSTFLLYIILGLAGCVIALGLWRNQPFEEVFMAAVALAVGAIPEGLPAAVTITLAIGVSRMAKRQAIIRRLPAVETLGSTTVICSDKTGTLTENQMTVQEIYAGEASYAVTGIGYIPEGEVVPKDALENMAFVECVRAGVLCNDSRLLQEKGLEWRVEGDPTEGALLVVGMKLGLFPKEQNLAYMRLDSLPFESEYQYMATLHKATSGEKVVYLKGAPEVVLDRCEQRLNEKGETLPIDRHELLKLVQGMAGQGFRVLAFAAVYNYPFEALNHQAVREGLVFLGLQAMIDPPRPEVIRAVAACHQAGIDVKMITGDHVITARAIAEAIGLKPLLTFEGSEIQAVTGSLLQSMSDDELKESIEKVTVFARVSPEQKLRLVQALQSRGHIVAMTGDGVNDAPALKAADIGVAMGRTGTEVAREAADMVLADDNFSSIEAAVEEGRCVFDNLIKFIVWTLPTNLGEGLVILAAMLLNVALPILPVQILWINMTTAVFLGLMLVFEPKEEDIMQRPPRDVMAPILTPWLIFRIVFVGALLLTVCFGLFNWALAHNYTLSEARTLAVNAFVVMELFYLFNCRHLMFPLFKGDFLSNPWVFWGAGLTLLLQVTYTYAPLMQRLFHSASMDWFAWLLVCAASAVVLVLVELEKWILRRVKEGHQKSNASFTL
jgi:cation-transporting ATPase F